MRECLTVVICFLDTKSTSPYIKFLLCNFIWGRTRKREREWERGERERIFRYLAHFPNTVEAITGTWNSVWASWRWQGPESPLPPRVCVSMKLDTQQRQNSSPDLDLHAGTQPCLSFRSPCSPHACCLKCKHAQRSFAYPCPCLICAWNMLTLLFPLI